MTSPLRQTALTCFKRTFKAGIPLLVLGFFSGCGKEAPAPVVTDRPVKMHTLESGGLTVQVEFPGQVFSIRQADMAFEVPGRMTEILVNESEEVEEGQLLARLEPTTYKAQLDAAAAQLEVARLEAERAQALFAKQATSKQRVDATVSQLRVAEANFEQAEKAYNDTSMRAPFSGVVAKVLVEDILDVQAKQKILILQDNSSMKVTVDLPETIGRGHDATVDPKVDVERMEPKVFLSYDPDRAIPARLQEFSILADMATRTYEATFTFDPPEDMLILSGMTARMVFIDQGPVTPDASVFGVPSTAVVASPDGDAFVWVFDEASSTVRRQQVTTGRLVDDFIEIFSADLEAGNRILTSGVQLVAEGQTVREYQPQNRS
jgi:RND family efflux transporter MFP subunit